MRPSARVDPAVERRDEVLPAPRAVQRREDEPRLGLARRSRKLVRGPHGVPEVVLVVLVELSQNPTSASPERARQTSLGRRVFGEYRWASISSRPRPLRVAAIDRARKGPSLRSGFGSTAKRWTSAGSHEPTETSVATSIAAGMATDERAARGCPRCAMRGAATHASAATTAMSDSAGNLGDGH